MYLIIPCYINCCKRWAFIYMWQSVHCNILFIGLRFGKVKRYVKVSVSVSSSHMFKIKVCTWIVANDLQQSEGKICRILDQFYDNIVKYLMKHYWIILHWRIFRQWRIIGDILYITWPKSFHTWNSWMSKSCVKRVYRNPKW